MEEEIPQTRLLVQKLEIDVSSLRTQLEKKQTELETAKTEFTRAEKNQEKMESIKVALFPSFKLDRTPAQRE